MSNRLTRTASVGLFLAAGLSAALPAGTTYAAAPVVERGGAQETFFDDFIHDLCGIDTLTTLTERWTLKTFADGSETLQVTRTFVSEDPRLPVEKGAGMSFTAPDGSRRVVGMPIHLIGPDGGTRLLDAGQVWFDVNGDVARQRGSAPVAGRRPGGLLLPGLTRPDSRPISLVHTSTRRVMRPARGREPRDA